MRGIVFRPLVVTAALAIVAAACSADAESSPSAASKASASSVTIAISSDEGTLTPFTNQTGYPGNNLVKLIFDPLAIVQGDKVVPLLAKEIKTTDNKVFT